MRALWLAVLGVAAYAAFLVGTMPASVLLARGHGALPAKYEVRGSAGTAWRGRADVVVSTAGGSLHLEILEWRWLPAALLGGRMAFAIHARAPGLDARYEGGRSLARWDLRGLEARGSAASMVALLPWLAPWRPEGDVMVTSPRLDTDGREVRGEARLEWRNAAVGLSEVKPLGSYRADIRAEGTTGNVALTTLQGPLRVTGQGTLTPPDRLAFTGEARAEGEQARALEPLLNLMGPARPDGARAIAWQVR